MAPTSANSPGAGGNAGPFSVPQTPMHINDLSLYPDLHRASRFSNLDRVIEND